MAIVGAILGDIAGSQYEFGRPIDLDWNNCKLFTDRCYFTDDTVMTLAAKLAIINGKSFADSYRELGRKYPDALESQTGTVRDREISDPAFVSI